MKTLVLCRHAKSDWPLGISDFDRPLKERGIADAERLGDLLLSNGFMPDLIVSSTANRAISTARIIAQKLGYSAEIVQDPSIYSESIGNLSSYVAQLPETVQTVMIFGHNPTMSETVRHLVRLETPFDMPTCGMVCLESLNSSWKMFRILGKHRWSLVPRLMRKGGDED